MSRLNDGIKCVVMLHNTILFLLGALTLLFAYLIYSGSLTAFNPDLYENFCQWGFVVGGLIIAVTIIGCVGANRQVMRDGYCTGRKLLSIYQLLLIGLLVTSAIGSSSLRATLSSIQYTLDQNGNTDYDEFEIAVSDTFNSNYFSGLCSEMPAQNWFMDFVDKHCPVSIQLETCKLAPGYIKDNCVTTCGTSPFDISSCCPSEVACDNGVLGACPYENCRMEALAWAADQLLPLVEFSFVLAIVMGSMVFLTCLMVCYNPKDSMSEILTKTGVVVEKKDPVDEHKQQKLQRKERRRSAARDERPKSREHKKSVGEMNIENQQQRLLVVKRGKLPKR